MKPISTFFLKVVIILITLAAIAGLIMFPLNEGRAQNLDLINIYTDPFIIYGYIASIPFFIGLYQSFKLLEYVDDNNVFSEAAIKAVKKIKYCAIALPVFIFFGEGYIILNAKANGEDAAGVAALGIYTTFIFVVIATFATVVQRILQNGIDLKSENDLTV